MSNEHLTRLHIDGKEIILVGTAHVSQQSVDLVKEVIETEQPDSVCIELDANRYENIKNPKAFENSDIVKVIKEKKAGFMLASLALSAYQRRMAKKLGTSVGGEMLQAIKSAEEFDSEIVLADRDIQTTFLRIWRKLSLWEKCKLITGLFFSFDDEEDIGEEDLQALMQEDMLESALHEVRSAFPKIGDILISERDQHLSQKIKTAPGKKIVAILGGAHIPGVTKAIEEDIDLTEITTVPPKKSYLKVLGWIIPLAIVALLVYAFATSLQTGLDQLTTWVLWCGALAAIGTALALGHPLSILTSLVVAPISALHPLLAVGWFSGLVQASVKKPTVQDLQNIHDDILSFKGVFRNKAIKVLLVVMFANIGASIGTFVAGAGIIKNLFGS